MSDIRLKWFVRRVLIPVIGWAMPRCSQSDLREAFDYAYKHRTEEWRQHVWSLAAERADRKVPWG